MKTCFFCLFLSFSIGLFPVNSHSEEIVILCDTPPESQMSLLEKSFADNHLQTRQMSQADFDTLASLENKSIVVYVHKPFIASVEKKLIDFCNDGGRLVVLHHAIASAKMQNRDWLPFCGIKLTKEKSARFPWTVLTNGTFHMVNLQPGHFVTTNKIDYDATVSYISSDQPSEMCSFQAFTLSDTELLMNQMFVDGRQKTVLFGYKFTDSVSGEIFMADRAGWLVKKNKGLLFYFLAGHCDADFLNKNFCRVILNALFFDPDGQ